MVKFIILDDVFDDETLNQFKTIERTDKIVWHAKTEVSPYDKILNICSNYFDMTDYAGYETWSNKTYVPEWHVDKEVSVGKFSDSTNSYLPICSIVYYPVIEDLKGGEFLTKDLTLIPKTNRLIMFSSEIYHKVNTYTGTRVALSINPWHKKPLNFKELLKSKIKKV